MAQALAAVVEKVKRFSQHARLTGGDGATVRVNLRENKAGAFNLSVTLKEPAAKKAQTGCNTTATTKEAAMVEFDRLVAVAVSHGWTKKEKAVRVPKTPDFTADTFPIAKPPVGGKGLAFPKKGSKK
jgi:hypothetical protein